MTVSGDRSRADAIAGLDLAGAIAAALAHDLGQPLNAMRLAAELASGPAPTPAQVQRALAVVVEQTGRARRLLDDLRAVTTLRHQRPPAAMAPLPPVRAALRAALPRLKADGLRLRWSADPHCPPVFGHGEWLTRIVAALVDNARAAMLGLDVAGTLVRVSCRAAGEGVRVSVADQGPGLPEGVRAALARPVPGRLGLGLTVAVGLAAEMGGRVEAVPISQGARVDLLLPAAGQM
jgi:two-component system C4-dicarboxylate transport sensor histidine kinase DctB